VVALTVEIGDPVGAGGVCVLANASAAESSPDADAVIWLLVDVMEGEAAFGKIVLETEVGSVEGVNLAPVTVDVCATTIPLCRTRAQFPKPETCLKETRQISAVDPPWHSVPGGSETTIS
jgi:hypothetical protein